MPISREQFDAEGVDPDKLRRSHLTKVMGVRLGREMTLRTWDEALAFCVPSPIFRSDFETHDEDVVKRIVQLSLEAKGWTVVAIRFGSEHGTDIIAERNGDTVIVEAKGMRQGQPGFRNYALVAIGQIALARERREWKSAIAFPAAGEYVRLLKRLPDSFRQDMQLAVFLVKKEDDAYCLGVLNAW